MARIDFPSTNEGFVEFKRYIEQYKGSNKMKLIIVGKEGAILRTKLATHYDAVYIKNLSEQQIKELEEFVGGSIDIWHVERFYWSEEVKEKQT